ncbi:hypothetical protein HXX02_06890 [Microbulbifer elongatus]|uniref:Lipoprotein n=1 Tax=Microbulbifer elongatus TaxID=86173 RepID=A0ABT1NZ55_9GAMM|nr:hypothetical protein [Microbulbifer elongatus]MCQ3829166.1 hypothetical protein [Microbulbifer elongatus]
MIHKGLHLIALVAVVSLLSACGGGNSSNSANNEGAPNPVENHPVIESFTSSEILSTDPPSFEVVVRFAKNVSRDDAHNIRVKAVVATDGSGDVMGQDFALVYSTDCRSESDRNVCGLTNYFFTYSYGDIAGWCCTVKGRNLSYEFTNADGYLQLTMLYHGKFTKSTYDNLVRGNVLTNIEAVIFSGSDKETILSRDYYPQENEFTDQLGELNDNLRDYDGSSDLIDIQSVTITNYLAP